jgi:Uncharacterised protein conserved in bacteria (DUF2313)
VSIESPTRVLVPLAEEWLAMLPPILQSDPWIQAIFNALAQEMLRLVERAEQVGLGLIPALANEQTLGIWEATLGLQVAPEGVNVEERRALIQGRLLRGDGSGAQWEAQVLAAAGALRYREHDPGGFVSEGQSSIDPAAFSPPDYTVNVLVGLPGGQSLQSLTQYIRSISPANLHLDVEGWTYGNLATEGGTYATLSTQFATYADLRDNRRLP